MLGGKKMNVIGAVFLLLATLVWGTSFIILKETIEQVPAFFVIAVRFIIAGGILSLIFIKKLRAGSKKTFVKGVILGLFLFLAYVTQTLGLDNTTAGRNAFITGSYCVICPFIIWILYKKKPTVKNIVSAILCIVGLAMVALSGDDGQAKNQLLGDGLTFLGAIFFAFQIVYIDRFQKDGEDTVSMLCYELLTVGVLFALLTLVFELPKGGIDGYSLNFDQIIRIGYLCLVCTLFAQFAQMFGQKYTSPNQTALILTLEAVFGVAFAMIIGDEKLTTTVGIGFGIIFVALLVSELNFNFSAWKKKNKENNQKKEEVAE